MPQRSSKDHEPVKGLCLALVPKVDPQSFWEDLLGFDADRGESPRFPHNGLNWTQASV